GFFGWQGAIFTLLVGSVVGSLVGISVMIARRGRLDMEIPFGPFLAAGAVLYMLYGSRLIQWYLDLPLLLS
ncbi:MAG: prepilin peptidase, partial [Candidatus Dadabacteria bacterium]